MAERGRFELPVAFQLRPLSRRVHSTTLPPLRFGDLLSLTAIVSTWQFCPGTAAAAASCIPVPANPGPASLQPKATLARPSASIRIRSGLHSPLELCRARRQHYGGSLSD